MPSRSLQPGRLSKRTSQRISAAQLDFSPMYAKAITPMEPIISCWKPCNSFFKWFANQVIMFKLREEKTLQKDFSWGKHSAWDFTCLPVPNWQESCIITALLQTKLMYSKSVHGHPPIRGSYGERSKRMPVLFHSETTLPKQEYF